ncbi:MAG: putative repeat protein (TIGR01451 family), partial [Sulfitobacter sp.]
MSTKGGIESFTSFAGSLSANPVSTVQGDLTRHAFDSINNLTIKKYASAALFALAFLFVPFHSVSAAPADGDILTNLASLKYQGSSGSLDAQSLVTFRDPSGAALQSPTDVLLACTVEAECSGGLIIENTPGQILGDLSVVDPDTTSGHSLSVLDDIRFEIVDGKLKLTDDLFIDFEAESGIDITIRAFDPDGLSVDRVISIVVRDVNEAPFDLETTNGFVVPGSPERRIGELSASDVDANETQTFSVIGDDRFTVLDGNILGLAEGVILEADVTIPVTVVVTDKGGLTTRFLINISTNPPPPAPAPPGGPIIELLAPDATGESVEIPPATCSASPGFILDTGATSLRTNLVPGDVSGTRSLATVDAYAIGDPVIVSVKDAQANLHPFELDRIEVRLDIVATGDSELLTLVETDVDSGSFFGFVFTTSQQSVTNDCILTVASRTQVDATYTNIDGLQVVTTLAQIAPVGILFNDDTGEPINGVILALINEDTGEPAAVSGDGPNFALYPSSVLTGETIKDASGAIYVNGLGEYRFPAIPDGRYRLVIFNDEGWNFSAKINEEIQALGGQTTLTTTANGQFVLTDASRGEPFNLSQGAFPRVDIPVKQLARPAPVEPTPSTIEFLQYSANPNVGSIVNVGQTTCVAGVERQVSELRDVSVPVPGPVNLAPVTVYKAGQPVFVRVADADQNFDPLVREKITIELTVPASGDREFLRLTETEPDSGQFVGYVQSTANESQNGSCMLGVVKNEPIRTRYSDIFDETDNADSIVLVDPFGKIFSTKDGRLIDGVSVTLIDTSTGLPAAVFGDSPAFAVYPSTVVSGGEVTDDAGIMYDFPAGEYRFPFVEPGSYRLQFDDIPAGLVMPSTATNEAIQGLPGAPFQIVDGSFGDDFEVPVGPALNIDIPVDEAQGEIFISKQTSSQVVGIGDFVQYRIGIQNRLQSDVQNTQVQDTLPMGFRYQAGSLRINALKVADPMLGDNGRSLLIDLPTVSGTETSVTYVTEVTPAASIGEARNSAIVIGSLVTSSNTAFASVMVRSDLFSEKAFLIGKVVLETCPEDETDSTENVDAGADVEPEEMQGIPGVRIYLEDGSYVVTDENGSWHMEGIEPGTHIVQMDVDTLEERYEASPCNDNSRFSGSPYSQFVDVRGGALWRADFKVQDRAPPESQIELSQTLKVDGEGVWVEVQAKNKGKVQVNDANVIYSVPRGWQIVKGTEVLDGQPTGHKPSIVGSIYSIGALSDSKTLRFVIEPKNVRKTETSIKGENKFEVLRPRFKTRSAELSLQDKKELDQLTSEWLDTKWRQITIVGHSDNVPIASANVKEFTNNKVLSEARAAAVAEYIADKVNVDELVVVGAGDKYPVSSNETREGRASNRRVEFLLKPIPEVVTKNIVDAEVLNGESMARMSFKSAGTPKGRTDTSKLPLNRLVGGFDKLNATASGIALGSWDLVANLSAIDVVERDPNVQGFINIVDGERMGRSIKAVKFDLDSRLQPRLMLDGVEVSSERIGFRAEDAATGKTLYSYIGVDFGEPGSHELTIEGLGPFGNARYNETINVIRVGELYSIKLLSAEGNIADGTTPVSVKLALYDKANEPLGIAYRLTLSDSQLRRDITSLSLTDLSKMSDTNFVEVNDSGVLNFDPVSVSGSYKFTLSFNDFEKEFEVFVAPEKREWIMVGLAEGSVAYNSISGNIENAGDAGLEDQVDTEGRIAFYAKGQVKGEFVLTMAYDTAKEKKNSLEQSIDPNSFYSLYGDKAATQYDASSQEKLYLKLEKDQFYALFGDFSTGLTGGELSNYSRSLSGLKSEFANDKFEVVVFASETDQAFIKDEIRGDGTSGIYRLSTKGLITNSEKISLETRDRFQSQDILETRELRRHLDYNIDYDVGTIFFKEPIFSQDPAFNPVFIVVDYEVDSNGADELNIGGRVAYKPIDNLEIGVTLVKEGIEGRESELAGIDLEYQLDDFTEIRAEIAGTRSSVDGIDSDGSAYLIEATRRNGALDASAYVREQQGAFGLGQQNVSESATRKIGFKAKYEVAEGIEVAGEVYRDSNLATGTDQDVATTSIQKRGDR